MALAPSEGDRIVYNADQDLWELHLGGSIRATVAGVVGRRKPGLPQAALQQFAANGDLDLLERVLAAG